MNAPKAARFERGLCLPDAEEGAGDPLIQEHVQQGDHAALYQIQGGDTQHHEGGYSVDTAVDGGTHTDDGFQRDAVELGEFGQQVHGVEGGAKHGHGQGTQNQADEGAVAALVRMVENHCGQHQTAAHHKVGEIAHKSGGGSLNPVSYTHLTLPTICSV